jgi:hypothetical protein
MKALIKELDEDTKPVIITDNDGTRKSTENLGFHKRTKHITYLQQQHELEELQIEWKAGKWNKVHISTKALTMPKLT